MRLICIELPTVPAAEGGWIHRQRWEVQSAPAVQGGCNMNVTQVVSSDFIGNSMSCVFDKGPPRCYMCNI